MGNVMQIARTSIIIRRSQCTPPKWCRRKENPRLARTRPNPLVFTKRRGPKAIEVHLWPYALRMANQIMNETPLPEDPTLRLSTQIFASTLVDHNPKHYHPFGCPVYVLNEALQTQVIHGKWKERSRPGIYLGMSPRHNRNVALVLNPETGRASPQFHVKFDDSFHTVEQERIDSKWQEKSGFRQQDDSKVNMQPINESRASKRRDQPGKKRLHKKQKLGRTDLQPPQREQEPLASEEDRASQEENGTDQAQIAPQPTLTTRSGRLVKLNPKYLQEVIVTEIMV